MNDDILKDITGRIISSHPNTYAFTKAIAEQMLLDERDQLPVAIFRPSIVTASVREPFPVKTIPLVLVYMITCITYFWAKLAED